MGTLTIHAPNGRDQSTLTLNDILHALAIGYTLVSLGVLDKNSYCTSIGSSNLELFAPGGEHVTHIPQTAHSLYRIKHMGESVHAIETISVMELHHHMGHIAPASTRTLVEKNLVTGIKLDPNSQETQCNACIFVRTTRKPIPKLRVGPQVQRFGEEVHMDVWGPLPITSKCSCRYFITFTDDTTWYTVTYLLRTKAEALGAYKTFEAWALTQQHCATIKVLRSDCGSEYLSDAFNQHLKLASTARCLTMHDTPQLNSMAERLNCMLMECIQAFMHTSGLPKFLWGEALRHATWLKNRTATWALDGLTPHQALLGRAPNLSGLQRWGTTMWVHDANGTKLDAHMCKGHWLGFDTESHAHCVYFSATHNVTTECNVYFSMAAQLKGEEIMILGTECKQHAARPTPTTLPPIQTLMQKSHTPTSPLSPLTPLSDSSRTSASTGMEGDDEADPGRTPRPTRMCKPSRTLRKLMEGVGVSSAHCSDPSIATGLQLPGRFDEGVKETGGVWATKSAFAALKESEWLEHILAAETTEAEALEPRMLTKAKCCPDWPLWENTITKELATLKTAGTWRLEEAPPGANVISSKWVFKAKKDAARNIAHYKACLVAQGFSQIGGVDYDNTYAPIVKLASSRALIAMAN